MKKKYLFYLICFILSNEMYGQNVFQKDYLSSFFPSNFYEESNGDLITGLLGFGRIDSQGGIITQRSFVPPLILSFDKIFSYKVNFMISGTSLDTCTGQQSRDPLISIVDSNGNILVKMEYRFSSHCSNYTFFTTVNQDSGVISGGREEIVNCNQCWTGNFYAFCTDSLFNIKWSKYYSGQNGYPHLGKQTIDSTFIIGLNLTNAGASLLKLDTLGNTVWCKSYLRPGGYFRDILLEQDSTYILTGYTASGFPRKLFILKINSSGQVLWCKGFDSDYGMPSSVARIISTSDNNYMLLASVYSANSRPKALLIKTDKNGDTLWTKVYGSYYYSYTPQSIIQTKDTGYLFGGNTDGNYPQNNVSAAFLYKSDSLGNTSCNLSSLPIYTYNLFPTDSDITLVSVDGGAYARQAYVRDTSYGAIAAYDDCSITGIPKNTSQSLNYSVQPNPSTGLFHIYRADVYTSDCYYAVYNSIGKLLIQQKFVNGNKDTEINLSRYGKGIYLIKITEGVEVITKKVVIE
jgi:hypothetical protein